MTSNGPWIAETRSASSGGVRFIVPANGITDKDARRFGLDSKNPGYAMMRDMGWTGGSIGKWSDGIATSLSGWSTGGQRTRYGIGYLRDAESPAGHNNTSKEQRQRKRRRSNNDNTNSTNSKQQRQLKNVHFCKQKQHQK